MAHRPITGRLVIATHNPGKLAEMRELLALYGIEAVSAGELGLPEPEETGTSFRANARIKAEAAAKAVGHAGVRRRFRTRGRCARRRARHPFGALGRAGQGFSPGDERSADPADRARRQGRRSGGARISSRRCASPGPTAMSRSSRRRSTARWSGRRAAPRASATIRCSCPTARPAPSARCRARRSTACRRTAAACRTAPAPSSSSRRRVLRKR